MALTLQENMAARREKTSRNARKCAEISRILLKEEARAQVRKISSILKTPPEKRTLEETQLLEQSADIASDIERRARVRELNKQRQLEVEDDDDELRVKSRQLADVIRNAKNLVVYTGAGISTAASIPDYRGPNGVWTLLQQGKQPQAQDLCDAYPTFTHMSIAKLYKESMVKYVVSQNCDGLHLRSGLPRQCLSEVHGNMYIEVCTNCKPVREYVRAFDVTENTAVRKHKTKRKCHQCDEDLKDTIVHFGEKGRFDTPYNWEEAASAAEKADVILCLGSSLKILKKYPCLWCMNRPPAKRPKLYIVNLQWTPKDDVSCLKLNGRCDKVMKYVMKELCLDVDDYQGQSDPLFMLTNDLRPGEESSTTKKILKAPNDYDPDLVKRILLTSTEEKSEATGRRKRKNSKCEVQTNGTSDKLKSTSSRNSKKSKKETDANANKRSVSKRKSTIEYNAEIKSSATNDGIMCGTDAMNYKRPGPRVKAKSDKTDNDTLILPKEKPFGNEQKVNNWLMSQPNNPLPGVLDPPDVPPPQTISAPTTYSSDLKADALSAVRASYPSLVCALQNTNYVPMSLQAVRPSILSLSTPSTVGNVTDSSVMQTLSFGFPAGFAHGFAQPPITWTHPSFAQLYPSSVVNSLPQMHNVSPHTQVSHQALGLPGPTSTITTTGVLSSHMEESQDKKLSNSSNAVGLSSGSATSTRDSSAPHLNNIGNGRLSASLFTTENHSALLTSAADARTSALEAVHQLSKAQSAAPFSNVTPIMSAPGWFGKGLNLKKTRKKRTK